MVNAVKVNNFEAIAVATSILEPVINYPVTLKNPHLKPESHLELNSKLPELAAKNNFSASDLLESALCTVIYRHTGQSVFTYTRLFGATSISNIRVNMESAPTLTRLAEELKQLIAPQPDTHAISKVANTAFIRVDNDKASLPLEDIYQRLSDSECAIALIISETKIAPHTVTARWWLRHNDTKTIAIQSSLSTCLYRVLEQLSQKTDITVDEINILDRSEIQKINNVLTGAHRDSSNIPVHETILNFSKTTPNNIAVKFNNTSLTYRELGEKTLLIRRFLSEKNIGIGDCIATALAPSLDVIPFILGIYSSGAVYVPLDISFPKKRIADIFNEIEPALIITDESSLQLFSDYTIQAVTITEALRSQVTAEHTPSCIPLEAASHIFFTSGTTGKPKGVVSRHSNLNHYIHSAINRYGFSNNDILLSAAKYTFSISLFELLVPLAAGGCTQITSREDVLDLRKLTQAVTNVTAFHFGPSLLKKLLPYIIETHPDLTPFTSLRHVSSGGDMVPVQVLQGLKQVFRHAEIFIIYGSSEVSCMACTYEVTQAANEITESRVGSPHQNTKIEILNDALQAVPRGIIGNIFIAGAGVTQGYLNQSVLTKKSFISIDNERFYSMGDLGRLDEKGNIELIGRKDFQVQIRGMRIELQEIEASLKTIEGITDCVVVAREKGPSKTESYDNDVQLIAYLVFNNKVKGASESIFKTLRSDLPSYMVPSLLVELEQLPLNHNGKLDRSQLPAPSQKNTLVSGEAESPSNATEELLAQLLQRLLDLPSIGVNHNFFELGGDSLAAVKYIYAIEKEFNKTVPITYLLKHPSIKEMASLITNDDKIKTEGDVVILKQGNPQREPLFCLYGIFLYKDLADELNSDRTVCGVYLEQEILLMKEGANTSELQSFLNVNTMAELYLKVIKAHQPNGPYFLCGESFGGIIALEVARQLKSNNEVVTFVGLLDTSGPGFLATLTSSQKLWIHAKLLFSKGLPYAKQLLSRKAGSLKRKETQQDTNNYRADARQIASKNYSPSPYNSPVVLYRAQDRSPFEPSTKDLGWKKYIQHLTTHSVSGGHLSMLKKGCVHDLARKIEPYLKQ